MYERSSNKPPSCRGGVVGQKENSCIKEVRLLVISNFSLESKAGKSGCEAMLCKEAW